MRMCCNMFNGGENTCGSVSGWISESFELGLTSKASNTTIAEFANTVDPDETVTS